MDTVKKYLIISAVFPPEPVVSAILSKDIATELSKTENIVVICPKPTRPLGFKFGYSEKNEFKTIVLDSYTCPQYSIIGRLRESYSFGRKCALYIKQHHNHIKLIYANAWPLFSQYWIVKYAHRYNIPCVLHIQDIYPESFTNKFPSFLRKIANNMLLPIDRFNLNKSDKIIAISEKMKDFFCNNRKINSDKIEVVYNWQDEQEFVNFQNQTISNRHDDCFTFMYLGNVGPLAGLELLIDAFSYININDCRLIIAGSGSMIDQLKKRASGKSNIHFWDVPQGDVPKIQSLSDVMILPVKMGGSITSIPSKLLAYMFSAKPVLACVDNESDTFQTIQNSGCGWVVEPENIDLLKNQIETIVRMPGQKLHEMGKMGYQYAISLFSKKKNLSEIIKIIQDL